ncbi:MAG: VOC family protein [Saprospiraceae bacterium]
MIALLVIKTNQLEKQKAFYESFDLIFQKEKHGNGPEHFSSIIKNQKIILEIYPLQKNQSLPDSTTRLGFRVNNLEKTIDVILEIGGEVKSEIQETEFGTLAVVKDFDGRNVEVYQK